MANFCILRIKKLHSNANVGGAISHHLRTRETENADPEKIRQNWFYPNDVFHEGDKYDREKNTDIEIRKKAQQQAMAMYKKRLPDKIRKNAVRAVEFMMTVSPEVMSRKDFNATKYLNACNQWACDKFGTKNVFFMAYHKDETTPHISILLTPIDENGKLNARKFFGGRDKMRALQDDFYNKVGQSFGLERGIRGSKAKHQSIQKYYSELNRQEKQIDDVAQAVKLMFPDKRFGQSKDEYRAEIVRVVQGELDTLKPMLKDAIDIETQKEQVRKDRKRLGREKADFEAEMGTRKNALQSAERAFDVRVRNEVDAQVNGLIIPQLRERFEDAYVPRKMKFKKGDKSVDFNKMSYSQMAEELASFYLDDEQTVHKRKREIEREFERNRTYTQGY